MADRLSIAKAGPGDRDDWLRLWGEWQRHMSGAVPDHITERTWDMIVAPQSGLFALLARNGSGALGMANASSTDFAWTAGPILFLQDLYVTPEARGLGAGSALLKNIYEEADAIGAAQVFWMVDEDDPELQGFYARHAIRTPYLRYMRRGWDW